MSTIFITGIDTGSGKSYTTGMLWSYLKQNSQQAITSFIVHLKLQISYYSINVNL